MFRKGEMRVDDCNTWFVTFSFKNIPKYYQYYYYVSTCNQSGGLFYHTQLYIYLDKFIAVAVEIIDGNVHERPAPLENVTI